jgi:hypothetical protein
LHYANARALWGTDARRLPPAGAQAAAQSLYAGPDVGVGMVNGSGVQREENRDQLHGRNITRENEEVSEDMRVDIPGIIVCIVFPSSSILKRKETPLSTKRRTILTRTSRTTHVF